MLWKIPKQYLQIVEEIFLRALAVIEYHVFYCFEQIQTLLRSEVRNKRTQQTHLCFTLCVHSKIFDRFAPHLTYVLMQLYIDFKFMIILEEICIFFKYIPLYFMVYYVRGCLGVNERHTDFSSSLTV